MSQPNTPETPGIPNLPNPPQPPMVADARVTHNPEMQEQVIYDGPVSWIGRRWAFFWTYLLALLLIIVPIGIRIWTQINEPWWVIAGAVILAVVLVVGQGFYHGTMRFRITNYRIDYERGMLTRKIDSLELWYIDHINFRQTLLERMGRVGTIEVVTDDPRARDVHLLSIPNAREVFDKIKSSTLAAKRQRGLIEMEQ